VPEHHLVEVTGYGPGAVAIIELEA
jgi:hypothetical protein